jgi:catechol 2,3-dioxygenase-like lactoylglutathione lyase family enzyme
LAADVSADAVVIDREFRCFEERQFLLASGRKGKALTKLGMSGETGMIGYVTLGTNDFEKAKAFYDAVLSEAGGRRVMGFERMQLWGSAPGSAMLAICQPYDGRAASVGNGVMPAINAASKEIVDKTYAKALESGATDEGPPGQRGDTFYGAYFRDLDGNKLCIFYPG